MANSVKVTVANKKKPLQYRLAVRGKDIHPFLFDVLEVKTPHPNEEPVHEIIRKYLKDNAEFTPKEDQYGNLHLKIPNRDGSNSNTLFSCHTDTVQAKTGKIQLAVTTGPSDTDKDFVIGLERVIEKDLKTKEEFEVVKRCVLGADDKLGIYILCKMICAGIPGYYIFHRGEERGGLGSKWIASNMKDQIKHIKKAIAFDRANLKDVIYSQHGGQCISRDFEKELCGKLNEKLKEYLPNAPVYKGAIGSFTDTASYTEIISECTNISVGYYNQHSRDEHFDIWWLDHILLPMILTIDWESLGYYRKPEVNRSNYGAFNYYGKHTQAKPGKVALIPSSVYNKVDGMLSNPQDYDDLFSMIYAYNPNGYAIDMPPVLEGIKEWTPFSSIAGLTSAEIRRRMFKWSFKAPWVLAEEATQMQLYTRMLENYISDMPAQFESLLKRIIVAKGFADASPKTIQNLLDDLEIFMKTNKKKFQHINSEMKDAYSDSVEEFEDMKTIDNINKEDKPAVVLTDKLVFVGNMIKVGKIVYQVLYSTRGKPMSVHRIKSCAPDTKLYTKNPNGQDLTHVYTITGKEEWHPLRLSRTSEKKGTASGQS